MIVQRDSALLAVIYSRSCLSIRGLLAPLDRRQRLLHGFWINTRRFFGELVVTSMSGGGLWISAATHFMDVVFLCTADRFTELRIFFHEGSNKCIKQPEHVITDQHLAITVRTGTDADRWDFQSGSYGFGNFSGNRFEDSRAIVAS